MATIDDLRYIKEACLLLTIDVLNSMIGGNDSVHLKSLLKTLEESKKELDVMIACVSQDIEYIFIERKDLNMDLLKYLERITEKALLEEGDDDFICNLSDFIIAMKDLIE